MAGTQFLRIGLMSCGEAPSGSWQARFRELLQDHRTGPVLTAPQAGMDGGDRLPLAEPDTFALLSFKPRFVWAPWAGVRVPPRERS